MFCCRRRESLDLDQSEDAEAIPAGEVFTVSGQVPVPPNTARTVPQYSDRNASLSKRPVLAGDVESVGTRTTTDAEKEAGTRRIVFGRERARVLDLLRRRTAELCVYLEQNVHTAELCVYLKQNVHTAELCVYLKQNVHTAELCVYLKQNVHLSLIHI